MIEILTLVSGLLAGPQHVELAVSAAAQSVEIRLDGGQVETLAEPPWTFTVELGEGLLPHRLELTSRDAAGRGLDREELWLNQPPGGPAAIREAGGDVYLVVEPTAAPAFAPLVRERKRYLQYKAIPTWDSPAAMHQLGAGYRYLVLFPGSDEAVATAERDLFAAFRDLGPRKKIGEGLSHLLTHWWPQPTPGRAADAVAVAARWAVDQPRPRAVVLVSAGEEDGSLLSPADARAYLAALGVPFHVWTPWPEAAAEAIETRWGEVDSVYEWGRFEAAADRLRASLKAQREARPARREGAVR